MRNPSAARRVLARIVVATTLAFTAHALAQGPVPSGGAPPKILHVAFPVSETGFDPQATSDLYSDHVQRAIFESLYGFDYLARPY
jgi:ABC-type transport system substrate-binding protein